MAARSATSPGRRRPVVGPSVLMALLAGWLSLGVFARQATITTADGRVLEGEVVAQDDQQVTLRITGLDTSIARSDISQITYIASLEEQYQQRRGELADDDLAGRYRLALWLFDNKLYDQSEQELDKLKERLTAEDQPDADLLRRIDILGAALEKRLKLLRQAEEAAQQERAMLDTPAANPDAAAGDQRLTPAQINRIRLHEVDLAERPRVRVPRDVIDDLLVRYADRDIVPKGREDQAKLLASPGWMQLDLIFRLRAREYYDRVEIVDDPPPLRTFRTDIHQRYVLNYCGSNNCHGGTEPVGGLHVLRVYPNRVDTVYTNFFRLQSLHADEWEMLDRAKPERSVLLQLGLPRVKALFPHPDVKGWRPLFASEHDPLYQLMLTWLRSGLVHPTPDYQIPPAVAGPRTQPSATEPAGP
ncbi:MAG: hypothetical protein IT442_12115 [Phycisphaeraceae bacterium]|nr:hypothetical protein [Phycisphaeraceae bacterium]